MSVLKYLTKDSIFCLLLLSIKNQHVFLENNFFDWMFFVIFIAKNTNDDGIIFVVVVVFDFVNVSNFDCNFYFFKIKFFSKIFVSFCNSCWAMICRI